MNLDKPTCPDLAAMAIKHRLIFQGTQPGTDRIPASYLYLCVNRKSPCNGNTLALPVTHATPGHLEQIYLDTRQAFMDAAPRFETLPEPQEA